MAESSLAQDFIAGVDPFGIYTSQYGQQAEQAGLSEKQHKLKTTVSALGGIAGGGVVVPTAVSGIASGITEAAKGGGPLSARLARAAKGFVTGAQAPWKSLGSAFTARAAINRAARTPGGARLSDKEIKAIKNLMGGATLKSVFSTTSDPSKGFLSRLVGAKDTFSGLGAFATQGRLTQQLAQRAKAPISTGIKAGVGGLAIGGAVGGGGAAIQYRKGRQSEQKFQRRLAMNKMSSVQEAALWSAFDLEMDKIAKANVAGDIAYAAGGKVRAIIDALKAPGKAKKNLYRQYAKGYHKSPRHMRDVLTRAQKEIPASMLLIPGLAGAGAAAGAYSKGKLRKKADAAAAFERQYYDQSAYGEDF